jgi:hypothetical protein
MEQIIREKQNLTYLSWSRIRHSSGTAGSFLKSYSELGGIKTYYKLSNFDSVRGVIGHECVNEIIVDRLLNILGIEHLHYRLIHGDIIVSDKPYDVYLCASENFRKAGESKIALDTYYELEHIESESPLDFCIRNGWENYIYQMLAVDFLILNRDRHGANIELLRNTSKRTVRLAPLFDHGLSLMFNCLNNSDIESYDVMEDKLTNNYIGSRSTLENLKLIPADKKPVLNPLKITHKNILLDGLDGILPQKHLEKIWDMIWKRWCSYGDFFNSKRI